MRPRHRSPSAWVSCVKRPALSHMPTGHATMAQLVVFQFRCFRPLQAHAALATGSFWPAKETKIEVDCNNRKAWLGFFLHTLKRKGIYGKCFNPTTCVHYNTDDSLKHGYRLSDTFAVEHPICATFSRTVGLFLECNQLILYVEHISHRTTGNNTNLCLIYII